MLQEFTFHVFVMLCVGLGLAEAAEEADVVLQLCARSLYAIYEEGFPCFGKPRCLCGIYPDGSE